MKPGLTFYSNIPSPYNIDFFEALSNHFDLSVVYYCSIERDRQWNLVEGADRYRKTCLTNNALARLVQRFKGDFHFSSSIFKVAVADDSPFVVVSGNYYIPNTLVVLLVAKLRGKQILWFGEKLFSTDSKLKFLAKKLLLLPLRSSARALLCIGEAAVQSYSRHGLDQPKEVIPYNINSRRYEPARLSPERLQRMRQTLNPEGRLIVVTSGSLIHRKGMDVAIAAFLGLPAALRAHAELWIMGDGELKEELRRQAGEGENVRFLGFQEQDAIPYYYALADVFLFCSRYDGWGVVVNEAMSAGLPVVVSDRVVASELIQEGEGGYVCPSDSVPAFGAALERILADAPLREAMGAFNQRRAALWSSEAMASKLAKICERYGSL